MRKFTQMVLNDEKGVALSLPRTARGYCCSILQLFQQSHFNQQQRFNTIRIMAASTFAHPTPAHQRIRLKRGQNGFRLNGRPRLSSHQLALLDKRLLV